MASTTCGWCGRLSHMTQVMPARETPEETGYGWLAMAAYQCDNCARLSLATGSVSQRGEKVLYEDEYEEDAYEGLTWLPLGARPRTFEDVPEHIASAATEAYACLDMGLLRAAVQLARSVVEATAKEENITAGNLYEKIETLHERSLIRELVRDAAHEVRHLGNDMAHGDFVAPVNMEEATEVLDLMAEVLNEVFQSPARVARRRQARLSKQGGD